MRLSIVGSIEPDAEHYTGGGPARGRGPIGSCLGIPVDCELPLED